MLACGEADVVELEIGDAVKLESSKDTLGASRVEGTVNFDRHDIRWDFRA